MQVQAEERSLSAMMDPWSIFLYGMKAPMTSKYRLSIDSIDSTSMTKMQSDRHPSVDLCKN